MKGILAFLVLIGFSFDLAHKCDFFFVGNVDYRGRGDAVGTEDSSTLQGCKKGCFFNATYTDDGVPKCQKCTEISNEELCLSHTATCQWKNGKCKSQSCPGIAKARVALYGPDINDNSTREALYRQQIKNENECIEGSALEQKYNKLYLDDYLATYNYQYAVWNRADTCTVPGSTATGYGPYAWANVVTNNPATNAATCAKFIGYSYAANTGVPPDPTQDACYKTPCQVNPPQDLSTGTPGGYQSTCQGIPGCIYVRGTSANGFGCDADGTNCNQGDRISDQCLLATAKPSRTAGYDQYGQPIYEYFSPCDMTYDSETSGARRWRAGVNNATECQNKVGCAFIPGAGGGINQQTGQLQRLRDEDGLTATDQCVPQCTPFTAGTSTRKDCEQLGCTYDGGDSEQGWSSQIPDLNRKTAEDKDNCDPARLASANRPDFYGGLRCGINTTLDLNYNDDQSSACIDRTTGASCSIPAFITEEDCKSGRGTWTPVTKECRLLESTIRSRCEFQARDVQNSVVYVKGLNQHGGNLRPGTQYERCVQDGYDELDNFKLTTVANYAGVNVTIYAFLTAEDREKIYGYRTPEEYCQHQLDIRLEACQRAYEANTQTECQRPIINRQLAPTSWTHNSVQIRASRSACHRIYGCMYSRSNERCSVWSVWAFILTLILVILVFVVALGVGAIVLLPIIKKSSA